MISLVYLAGTHACTEEMGNTKGAVSAPWMCKRARCVRIAGNGVRIAEPEAKKSFLSTVAFGFFIFQIVIEHDYIDHCVRFGGREITCTCGEDLAVSSQEDSSADPGWSGPTGRESDHDKGRIKRRIVNIVWLSLNVLHPRKARCKSVTMGMQKGRRNGRGTAVFPQRPMLRSWDPA